MPGQPQSPDDWVKLARRQIRAARTLLAEKHFEEAWSHGGFAVECTLKAAIMRSERLNAWPEKSSRPDLYVHNLTNLAAILGIDLVSLRNDPVYTDWLVVRMWRRGESYNPSDMPRKVAEDMVDASGGPEGMMRWIEARFHLS